jgi:hypothetical protein
MSKHEQPCPTCTSSGRKGLLKISANDWVECPDCDATGTFVCYEQLITPPRHFIMPGLKGN